MRNLSFPLCRWLRDQLTLTRWAHASKELGDFFWQEVQSHRSLLESGCNHLGSSVCLFHIACDHLLEIQPDKGLIFANGNASIQADRASPFSNTERDAGITTQILDFLAVAWSTHDERPIICQQIVDRSDVGTAIFVQCTDYRNMVFTKKLPGLIRKHVCHRSLSFSSQWLLGMQH